jgi:hypothetical protein
MHVAYQCFSMPSMIYANRTAINCYVVLTETIRPGSRRIKGLETGKYLPHRHVFAGLMGTMVF